MPDVRDLPQWIPFELPPGHIPLAEDGHRVSIWSPPDHTAQPFNLKLLIWNNSWVKYLCMLFSSWKFLTDKKA